MNQYLTIHAESYTPVGEGSIPLGENAPVEGIRWISAHRIRLVMRLKPTLSS